MTPAFDQAVKLLKQLPGLGHRSAERIALHLFAEQPQRLPELLTSLAKAGRELCRCSVCGNLAEGTQCSVCADPRRDASTICVVESVPEVQSLERAGVFKGTYHVLHGKLSPLRGVGPEQLNIASLLQRTAEPAVREVILAISNDMEGAATCHFLQEELRSCAHIHVTRIGFGLPSGSGLGLADPTTLRSALEGRRQFE